MIYFKVLGQHFIILSSLEVITDLLEKRSSNYSDRKQMTMSGELYVSHFFRLKELIKIGIQNEWENKHGLDALWPAVAKTQEIISRVFPL